MSARILVAGIGNVFLADDGWGVELANRLTAATADRPLPEGVVVEDFGIRGVHLAFELLNEWDAAVLLDAVPLGDEPGTLAVIEPEPAAAPAESDGGGARSPSLDAHSMSPAAVLALLAEMGGHVPVVRVVGCEPAEITERIGLSETVASTLERATDLVHEVVNELAAERAKEPTP